MALVVEDGTVVSGANSYASIAQADAYFAVDVNFATTWDDYSDLVKEQWLQWATRVLDQRVVWAGNRYDTDSALRWPRSGAYDNDGVLIANTTIPAQLRAAMFELIKYSVANDPTTTQEVTNISRIVADVVEIEYQPGTSQNTFPPIINQILYPIGRFRTGQLGFGRIVKA